MRTVIKTTIPTESSAEIRVSLEQDVQNHRNKIVAVELFSSGRLSYLSIPLNKVELELLIGSLKDLQRMQLNELSYFPKP